MNLDEQIKEIETYTILHIKKNVILANIKFFQKKCKK